MQYSQPKLPLEKPPIMSLQTLRLRTVLSFLLLSMSFCRCGQQQSGVNPGGGDSAFSQLSDAFLQGWLDWRPQAAVNLGFHQYDKGVTDYSKASLDAELKRLKEYSGKLEALDTATLSSHAFIDYRILRSAISNEIFNFENMKIYTQNPMTYAQAVDINTYVKRDFAPLEERVRSIIEVEKQIPALYSAAKTNLTDSLAKPYIDMAVNIAKGNAGFLSGDLLTALAPVKDDTLMAAFRGANQAAIAATNDYVRWLQTDRLPKAHLHYALGEENYRKFLYNNEMITLSPDKILEIGLAELKREQGVFNAAAHIINPKKTPVEVYHDMQKEHPSADSLISESKKHVEGIRQYLIDHQIVTMPSPVRIQVKETPLYARETSTASCDVPGPFETKAAEAYYYITPVDSKWTAQQKADWLASFNYYTTDVVTIHEAYPGHYTQFLHLNASAATRIEKIFSSYAYVEGWAHYTEKMMLDEGYGNNGDSVTAAKYRLAQSGDALLRICRLCVSVKTHCHGIGVDEATKFFMDNWYQGDKPSRQEALRGTFDPGYLFYTLGKLEILKLRADYQQQEGSHYSLKAFNDAMLDNGMPPIRLMREILLKDKNGWGDVL
jgi:uncharacterized protein (DUF885 family)